MRTSAFKTSFTAPAIAVVFLASCFSAAVAAEPPTVATIQAAMRHQATATIEVQFTVEFVNSPLNSPVPSGAVTVGAPKGLLTAVPKADGDTVRKSPVTTYIRTPEILYTKRYSTEESSEISSTGHILDYRSRSQNSDGSWRGAVSVVNFGAWTGQDRIETVLYPVYPRPDDASTLFLCHWVKYGVVRGEMESIDGHNCWKVDVTDTAKCIVKRYEMWLDPSIGLNPRRLAMYGDDDYNGKWSVVVDFKDYREIAEGIWFPAEQVLVKNVPKKGLVNRRLIFKAQELSGAKKYSKEDLHVKFEPGTEVSVRGPDGSITRITQL